MHLYDEAQKIFSDLYVTTVGLMLFQSISILLTLILESSGFAVYRYMYVKMSIVNHTYVSFQENKL